ncbi:MAG: hypothetical protein PF505_04295 [Vallitaleaceae bacterium]|jgi:hypothetical protein|nr:hypothetical protein [Vallitaleaceae bacterium]
MKELFNENSDVNKRITMVSSFIGIIAVILFIIAIYKDYTGRLIYMWIWILSFGTYLSLKGLSDMIYKKRKDGVLYLIIPVILLIVVIWYTAIYV